MITLLALLFVCHFLADFSPLSTAWMLQAKSKGTPLVPIFVHAGVHAILMLLVLLLFVTLPTALLLASFQLVTHFFIDVCKGRLNAGFPSVSNPNDKRYWVLFGLDQLLHQLVILCMVWGSIHF